MKRGKEEEEKELFQDKGPFTPLWERLLLAKDLFPLHDTELDSYVDKQLDNIKDGLQQISTAFLAIDEWRKDVVDQLEMLIRDTNKFAESKRPHGGDPLATPIFLKEDLVFPAIAEKIKHICDKVASFMPQVFESWKKSKQKMKVVVAEDTNGIKGLKAWDLNITAPIEKYKGMDDQIKSCFRCLCLFPENSIVRKRDLIYWWICEGFVQPRGEKTADEVGEECFHKLLEYDLINPIFNKGSNRIIGLTLHPSIRTFAISAAGENGFFSFDSQGKPTAWSNDNPSRACISGTEKIDIFPSPNMVNLVSIFNVDVLYLNFEKGVANNLNNLTVLQLGRWRSFPKHNNKTVNLTNLLECLPLLKSLRYLGLQDTYGISELPDKISNLSSLLVLDLGGCHDLERLPTTISKLKRLTHLDVSDCEVLQSLPFEVRNLELHVMKGLVIGNSITKTSLTDLKQWDKLRKLSINFGNQVEIDEVELGGVKHLRSLTTLIITWWVKNRNLLKTSTWNLDWLPECLQKLDLRCFPLEKLPSGLVPTKLKNLKRLYLRGGKLQSLEGLEVEGQKWQVEILRLRYLIELKEVSFSLFRVFPDLKYVEIDKCTNIEPFPADKWVNLGDLDKQLKSCLLCFSIFPKNFIVSCESFIYRRNLIYWWIGEGLVEPTGDKTAEQVGEDCFFKLIERGLIEPIAKMSTGIVGACKISPSIQYQVVCLAKGSQFFAFSDRKCLTKSSNPSESVSFSLTDALGCVINLNVQRLCFNSDATNTLKNLTVLDLGNGSTSSGHVDWLGMRAGDGITIENLDSFFKCLHLFKRLIYLGLAGVYGIEEIPDTISELSELRVLNLHSCYHLKRLSNEIVQLRKLTHLNMSGIISLRHMLMQLNDLEDLQVVKGFKFTYSKDVNQGDLSNLDKWKNLRKLSITFCDPQGTNELALGGVKHLLSLRSLSIVFICSFGSAVHLHWLPPNLEKLELIGSDLEELRPQVVQSLSNLKRLYLQDCGFRSLKVFVETSSGLNVQVLRLMDLFSLKLDWSEVRRIFPCLIYAYVNKCPALTSFRGDKYGVWRKDDTEGCLHDNEAAERRAIRAAERHAAERDAMWAAERRAIRAEERDAAEQDAGLAALIDARRAAERLAALLNKH